MSGSLWAEEAADLFVCGECHVLRIRDFKGRRANPIVPVEEYPEEPTGTQDIASTSGMCLSCHDGFVQDSREIWKKGHSGHRVGMQPSARVVQPELGGAPEFPMNEDGNMYCGTCHSAHLNDAEGAPEEVNLFMRASSDGGELCQACHQDKVDIADSVHDKGSRRSKDFEARGTCAYCHAPHASDKPLMWARGQGEGNTTVNRFCRDCHDDAPHPGEHPANVVAWSQQLRLSHRSRSPVEMPVFDEQGHAARVGQIGCPTCHNLHKERADGRPVQLAGLFLRMPELVQPLCADCHGRETIFLYKFFHSPASRR
jgi:predicted CXXCH cytochrome family protein